MTSRATEQEARRFLENGAPRPKRRKAPMPKPGAPKPPASVVWLIEDTERGRVLVRGKNLASVLEVAGVLDRAAWSVSAKGYVVDSRDVPDIGAAADYLSIPWRWRTLTVAGGDPDA